MKAPSRDIAVSLATQKVGGRGPERIEIGAQSRAGVSMTVPGDADVHAAPGNTGSCCASVYAYPMARFGGSGTIGPGAVPPAPRERRQFNRSSKP